MSNYEEKEFKLLEKIDSRINKLDEDLSKMDGTDSKVKHFLEQEKALHEIRSIAREEKRVDKLDDKVVEKATDSTVDVINEISKRIDDLDKDLDNLEDDDSKVKGYLAQKKTIHDIKELVKSILK